MGWNISSFKGIYESAGKFCNKATLRAKLLKFGVNSKDIAIAEELGVSPQRLLEAKKIGINIQNIARAKELGVSPEKLLELKQLGISTKAKTVSHEAMENIKPKHRSDVTLPRTGNSNMYDMGAYTQTIEDKDGNLVKILSNGMKIKIRKNPDGSRTREIFEHGFEKPSYSDTIKCSKKVEGDVVTRTKEVNSHSRIYNGWEELDAGSFYSRKMKGFNASGKGAEVEGFNYKNWDYYTDIKNCTKIDRTYDKNGRYLGKKVQIDGGTAQQSSKAFGETYHNRAASSKYHSTWQGEVLQGDKVKYFEKPDGQRINKEVIKPENSELHLVRKTPVSGNPNGVEINYYGVNKSPSEWVDRY